MSALFVRELGKYLIFRSSLFAMSPTSIWYMETCSIVDSSVSPENLVNFGTFHPLDNYVCKTNSANGDEYVGLWRHGFTPFRTMIRSTTTSKFCSPSIASCQTCLTTWLGSWFLLTNRMGGHWATLAIGPPTWCSWSIVSSNNSSCGTRVSGRGGGGEFVELLL